MGKYVNHLATVLLPAHPESEAGQIQAREMCTIARAFDAMSRHLGRLGVLLVQRLKDLEAQSSKGATPDMAMTHEPIPRSDGAGATAAERAHVASQEWHRPRLQEARLQSGASQQHE